MLLNSIMADFVSASKNNDQTVAPQLPGHCSPARADFWETDFPDDLKDEQFGKSFYFWKSDEER